MIYFERIVNFNDRIRSARKIHKSKISRNIVAESEFRAVSSCQGTNRRRIHQRHNSAYNSVSARIQPNRIRNNTISQTEAHIVGPSGRCHRIHIAARIRRNGFFGIAEASALHHTLPNGIGIRGTHIILHRRIAEITQPVIHPFHHVTDHVAGAIFGRLDGAYFMGLVIRIFCEPRFFNIPIKRSHINPFSFCRQAIACNLGMIGKTFQVRAMLFSIKRGVDISISRIEIFGLAASVGK